MEDTGPQSNASLSLSVQKKKKKKKASLLCDTNLERKVVDGVVDKVVSSSSSFSRSIFDARVNVRDVLSCVRSSIFLGKKNVFFDFFFFFGLFFLEKIIMGWKRRKKGSKNESLPLFSKEETAPSLQTRIDPRCRFK